MATNPSPAPGGDHHWLLNGLRGVNIVTIIGAVIALVWAYADLDKQIALIKQNQVAIERRLDGMVRTLNTIRQQTRGVSAGAPNSSTDRS